MAVGFVDMTQEQVDEFLSEPRNVVMGTVRKDGSPQLSAIWFLYRDGKLYTTVYNTSAKYYNIRRDPRVVVCVNAAHPDARSVTVFGTAELHGKDHPLYEEIEKGIAYQYHDSDEGAEKYLDASDEADASLIEVTPNKIISQDYN